MMKATYKMIDGSYGTLESPVIISKERDDGLVTLMGASKIQDITRGQYKNFVTQVNEFSLGESEKSS